MANTSYLQVRVNNEDKEKAQSILEELGTNMSSVVNMLIKQIIRTKSIPFEVKLTDEGGNAMKRTDYPEIIPFDDVDAAFLEQYKKADEERRARIRQAIIDEFA